MEVGLGVENTLGKEEEKYVKAIREVLSKYGLWGEVWV